MGGEWAVGDRGRVTGTLAGDAVVEELVDFDAIKVRVSLFGRSAVATVRPEQLVGEGGERRGLPPPAPDLATSLARLEARLAPFAAESGARPGATLAELEALRSELAPCPLPADLAALLAWRAGVRFDSTAVLVGARDVGELKGMMDRHVAAGRFDDHCPGDWWSAGWVPFTLDPRGAAMLVFDTVGSFGGQPGQILAWDRHPGRPIVAVSLAAWCAAWAEGLERGLLVASRDAIDPAPGQEGRWERLRRWLQPTLPPGGTARRRVSP